MEILYEAVIIIAIIYIYILICNYLKIKSNKNFKFIIIKSNDLFFIENENKEIIINGTLIKNIYIECNYIYMELTTNDTYLLKTCKSKNEALLLLDDIKNKLSVQ